MRYSVPVNAPDEVADLAAAGADELYCGYLDAWWAERYGDHDSASRRQGRANLSTSEELRATVCAARRYGLPIHLALNARYTEAQLDHLVELCGRFCDWGGTGVILSDLGLLWRLNDSRLVCGDLTITLSLLAVAQNTATLRAYRQLGVTRFVFPRFVGWREAGSLLSGMPGMEASVMAFFDKCPLVDGYCRHRHGVSYPDRNATAAGPAAPPLLTFDTTYRTHACLGSSCTYLEPYPCAACHLRHFERSGVRTAKIGGRGRPLEERLRALRFLRAAEAMGDDAGRRAFYRKTFDRPCACYYGEAIQNRYAIEPVVPPVGAEARVRVGSETSLEPFQRALAQLCRGDVPVDGSAEQPRAGLTLLVPPLSDDTLRAFLGSVPALVEHAPSGTHVAVNDLGTLVELTHAREASALQLTLGTLLARMDDPREVAHFLSAAENPPRPVWGPAGEPRMLMYALPSDELVRHWQTPSLTEPSAQAALAWLRNQDCQLPYEYAGDVSSTVRVVDPGDAV